MSLTKHFPPTNASAPYGPIDILPEVSSLSIALTITYTPTAYSEPIPLVGDSNGIKLTWQQTETQPMVSFSVEPTHEDSTYTLFMTDPDAPTPKDNKYSYWRHWIQPSSKASIAAKSDKAALTEYMGPGKKDVSADPHRYLFLLLREPSAGHPYHSLTKSDAGGENFEARRCFDAKGWIAKYELEPVAIVWFWGS